VIIFAARQTDNDWQDLHYGDTFTEVDVEMNKIRYNHKSILGSKSQVTDFYIAIRKKLHNLNIKMSPKSLQKRPFIQVITLKNF